MADEKPVVLDLLPKKVHVKRGAGARTLTPAQVELCRLDYFAGMPHDEMCAKWGLKSTVLYRMVTDHGWKALRDRERRLTAIGMTAVPELVQAQQQQLERVTGEVKAAWESNVREVLEPLSAQVSQMGRLTQRMTDFLEKAEMDSAENPMDIQTALVILTAVTQNQERMANTLSKLQNSLPGADAGGGITVVLDMGLGEGEQP